MGEKQNLLTSSSLLWQWDEALSLCDFDIYANEFRRLGAYESLPGEPLLEFFDPIGLEQVEKFESEFGFQLPVAYRHFMTRFSNGFVSSDDWLGGFFKFDQMVATANRRQRIELQSEFPIDIISELKQEFSVDESHPGLLQIGRAIGAFFLVINGPARGVVLGRSDDGIWGHIFLDFAEQPSNTFSALIKLFEHYCAE